MFQICRIPGACMLLCGFALALSVPSVAAGAKSFQVLHAFSGGSDGADPLAGLIIDSAGNLYGTTDSGGSGGCGHNDPGCGAVFRVAPDGAETVLYAFAQKKDGAYPVSSLVMDGAGDLYGTTQGGGNESCSQGCGTVFELATNGTATILHKFQGTTDGLDPAAGLVRDTAGDLFGTTEYGGGGYGSVFSLGPDGTKTVLHAFAGGSDGEFPQAVLLLDKAANLYGTTLTGGGSGCTYYDGCGTTFKLAPDGTETVLHAFTGGTDGGYPVAGLVADKAGNLYGTAESGGSDMTDCGGGCGVAFEIAPDGTQTVLHSFGGGSDGVLPYAGVVRDKAGNLFGTTLLGGTSTACVSGCGTVYELLPPAQQGGSWVERVIHSFARHDGADPQAGLTADKAGNLYGTTSAGGGHNAGTVFKIAKPSL
jgi:uncharacterized repeat protein (TIGR03803 family)